MVSEGSCSKNPASLASGELPERSVVILSSDDWGWKTSKYQVSTRLADFDKVLFVSSIGFRSPSLLDKGDISRIGRKLKSFFKGLKKIKPNLSVMTPLVIPFARFPAKSFFNRQLFKWQFKLALKSMGLTNPDIIVFSQNWAEYLNFLPKNKVIYYVVDKQSGFKGVNDQAFGDLDKALLTQSDLVVCCARSTYEYYKSRHTAVQYLPHGVNFDHFASALGPLVEPEDLQPLPAPRLLFFGHISNDWVDIDLLLSLADALPAVSIVLLGRMSLEDPNILLAKSNIHWLGEKEFSELPSYCTHCQVGLIPFVDTELTRNCNPLKLPEYLSAGLPVVSTAIPEVMRFEPSEFLSIADRESDVDGVSTTHFIDGCKAALSTIPDASSGNEQAQAFRQRISAPMSNETWESRVQQLRLWISSL